MADADELAAVWGPDGLATTDPSAIRIVARALPAPPEPAPTTAPAVVASAMSRPVVRRPADVSPKVAVAAVGVLVLAALVLVLALTGTARSRHDRALATRRLAVPTTNTTIVSAAADLLRARTTDDEEPEPLPPVTIADPSLPSPPTATATATAPTTPTTTAPPLQDVAGADRAAVAFSAAMNAADCDALWNLLSSRTQEFLEAAVRSSETTPRSLLCESLRTERPTTTVQDPARSLGDGRAVVPMAADGDAADITFVLERGAWVVDLLAMQDPASS